MMKKAFLVTNVKINSSDSNLLDLDIVQLDSDEDSYPVFMERIKIVENTQKDLNIKILTKGEWLLYWANAEGQSKHRSKHQRRRRRSLKEYISEVQKSSSANNGN